MKSSSVLITFLLCLGSVLSGQSASQEPAVQVDASQRTFVLGPDDSFTVAALNIEEISKDWRVGAGGDVTFPMVGRVHLAGLTVEQAEARLTELLTKYVKDPQVSIFVQQVRSRPVTVAGAVLRPGVVQISNWTTLSSLLVSVGGPEKNAGKLVTVRRSVREGTLTGPSVKMDSTGTYAVAELELKTVLDGSNGPGANADFRIYPNDMVTVAATPPARYVYIVGEVVRPGPAELVTQDSVSLMTLVATAGGLTRLASAGKTLILHVNADGVQTSTSSVNLKKVMYGKAKDVALTSGDIVMIPSSQAKSLSTMVTTSALNAGLSSLLYTTIARF